MKIDLPDLRRRNADFITGALMREIGDILPSDLLDAVHTRIYQALYQNGVMLICEKDRHALGLEPLDTTGWTPSERLRLKQEAERQLHQIMQGQIVPAEVLEGWRNVAIRSSKITINQE